LAKRSIPTLRVSESTEAHLILGQADLAKFVDYETALARQLERKLRQLGGLAALKGELQIELNGLLFTLAFRSRYLYEPKAT
jgi:hypothetical protein